MDKKRTLTCDCGENFITEEREFNGLMADAMACPKCNFVTLTKDQAQNLLQLKELQTFMEKERKVIKVGNSMGLTLPEKLTAIGVHIGQKVKMKPINDHSLVLSFE